MQAQPDLLGCTGVMLGVTGIGAGVSFGTAGVVGTAVVCGFGVTGVAGATGTGGMGCVGLVVAGCGAETQGLAGAPHMWVLWHLEQCQWA